MSYRRNVLVSDIPATHLVKLSESDYFPTGDAAVLAERLETKLKELPEKDYDLTAFDWQEIADRVALILRQAAGERLM